MNGSTFEEILARDGQLVYTNVGDSMLPLIRQGRDLLIIEKKGEGRLRKYDIPLYRRDNGQVILHRILKVRAEDYVICGDNRWQCETGITDRHIMGVLKAVVRNGHEIPTSSRRLRIYAHLWCDLFPLRALTLRTLAYIKRRLRGQAP